MEDEVSAAARQGSDRYEAPEIVDYGSLVELTASSSATDMEDGLGKLINTDGSNPMLP